jgi:exonuclease VII small subunit
VVLTPDAFRAIMKYIDMIEEELESTQLEMLLKAREDMENWETGEELSRKARESFLDRQELLQGLLDGDKQNNEGAAAATPFASSQNQRFDPQLSWMTHFRSTNCPG